MCGIAGYRVGQMVDHGILEKMVKALYHRGPDSEGYYSTPDYSAGMCRLRVNDLATGDQPLYSEDKSIVLFYNGEIYNYPQIRKNLESKGYHFRTRSDGEVICHLYSEIKENLFELLDGMFAVALWIVPEQKLILARDIPGEKPLYYIQLSDTELVFASEIKSLLSFPGWDHTLNMQALWDYPTYLWVPEPQTVFQSVMALPRGNVLISDNEGIRVYAYRNKFNQQSIDLDEDCVIEETRRVVTESIHSRLLSDVPVGSFLSSGLDSSIITTVAARVLPDLTTFTIGFDDIADPYHGTTDESKFAEKYAKALGLKHHTIFVTAEDFKRDLLTFCVHGDQPFAVSSGLGILSVARSAYENGIKVLLSGDGADECFGGYSWYHYLQSSDIYHNNVNQKDGNISFQHIGVKLDDRLDAIKSYSPAKQAWAWHYFASEDEKHSLFNKDYFENTQSSLRFFNDFSSKRYWAPEDFIKHDREFYLPFEMLRKVDRMTMAFSVEGRTPFAAPAVLAHVDKLKYQHLINRNNLKCVLRKAFAPILPKDIITRPKHGFNVPIDHWLKNDWADMVDETFEPGSSLMKQGMIHKDSHDIAIRMLNDPLKLNGHTIFSFIMLNLWLENIYGNYC